jgi:hypothetical protein
MIKVVDLTKDHSTSLRVQLLLGQEYNKRSDGLSLSKRRYVCAK